MTGKPLRSLVVVSAMLCLALQARAEGYDKFSALLTFATNYYYRAYTKSDNNPVFRANVDYEHGSGLYLGTWVSWVDMDDKRYSDRSDVEFYPYLGYLYKLNEDWRFDTAVARYIYNDKVQGRYSDYNEYSFSAKFRDLISGTFSYADDAYNRNEQSLNYELTGRYPLTSTLSASAGVGYNQAYHLLEYDTLYWNAGLTWYFHKFAAMDFRYVDYYSTRTNPDLGAIELPYITSQFLFSITAGF